MSLSNSFPSASLSPSAHSSDADTNPAYRFSATVELKGHLIDSLTLAKVMDLIQAGGGDYQLNDIQIGSHKSDLTAANLTVFAPDEALLTKILDIIRPHGAKPPEYQNAVLEPCPADGVFPQNFYATTNLPMEVLVADTWIPVASPMANGVIVVNPSNKTARVGTFIDVSRDDLVVVGDNGIRLVTLAEMRGQPQDHKQFFKANPVMASAEQPKIKTIAAIAEKLRFVKASGKKALVVAGAAVIHTHTQEALSRLISEKFIHALILGTDTATYDLESALYGTSSGKRLSDGFVVPATYANPLRTINRIRAVGSIRTAVEQGIVQAGVLHCCIKTDTPFMIAGSIGDDGLLPESVPDLREAQRQIREIVQSDVEVCLMLASKRLSLAVGNFLPATVQTVYVDINPSTLSQLTQQVASENIPLVKDVESFLRELADQLVSP